MKTDIQIAQEAVMEPIVKVAESIGIPADELELYGKYKAKISNEYYNEIKNYLVMYRAKGRNSARCETFRNKGLIAKVALAGKSIMVCLGIDPTSLEGTKYNYKDVNLIQVNLWL